MLPPVPVVELAVALELDDLVELLEDLTLDELAAPPLQLPKFFHS